MDFVFFEEKSENMEFEFGEFRKGEYNCIMKNFINRKSDSPFGFELGFDSSKELLLKLKSKENIDGSTFEKEKKTALMFFIKELFGTKFFRQECAVVGGICFL